MGTTTTLGSDVIAATANSIKTVLQSIPNDRGYVCVMHVPASDNMQMRFEFTKICQTGDLMNLVSLVPQLLTEIERLRIELIRASFTSPDALPETWKTADGVEVRPNMKLWAISENRVVETWKVDFTVWAKSPPYSVIRDIKDCYASREAAERAIRGRQVAAGLFNADQYDAWVRMGCQLCATCGAPLRPCPKGPGADEPGFVGFYPCRHSKEGASE